MGHLESLPSKIPQEPLSASLLETISVELNTQDRVIQLLQQLEVCIAFIVPVGASSVRNLDGNTTLSSYVVDTLRTSPEEWEAVSTPSIRQMVHLRHLQALFVSLEEKLYGDPLDEVLDCFSEKLSSEEENALRQVIPKLRMDVFLPIFRHFLVSQLTSTGLEPHCNLKEYLEYASEQSESLSFEEEEWWTPFPDSLTLRAAKAAFRLCQDFAAF